MIIFEDDESTPSSKLIKSMLGDQVLFTSGCERIRNVLNSNTGELCIVLLDVIPDNDATELFYESILDDYEDNDNVKIFKIPCIEYFIVLMLKQLNCLLETKDANLFFKLQGGEDISYTADSFEHFCKSIIKQQLPVCKRNANSNKITESGLFYTTSCLCGVHKPKCAQHITNIKKGCTLLRLLPAIPYNFNSSTDASEVCKYVQKNEKQIRKDIEYIYSLLRNIN